MTFQFKKVYDGMALMLDGLQIDHAFFGPLLIKIKLLDEENYAYHVADSQAILPYFLSNKGKEELPKMIDRELQKSEENLCVVLIHEGYVKTTPDVPQEVREAIKMQGLTNDPEARNVVLVTVYHRSEGKAMGFLPIGSDRKISYAPMLDEAPEITHVDVGAVEP